MFEEVAILADWRILRSKFCFGHVILFSWHGCLFLGLHQYGISDCSTESASLGPLPCCCLHSETPWCIFGFFLMLSLSVCNGLKFHKLLLKPCILRISLKFYSVAKTHRLVDHRALVFALRPVNCSARACISLFRVEFRNR